MDLVKKNPNLQGGREGKSSCIGESSRSAMTAASVEEKGNDVIVICPSSSQSPTHSQDKKRTASPAAEKIKKKKKNPTTEKTKASNKKNELNKDKDEDEEEDASSCRFPMSRVCRLVRGEGGTTDIRSSREAAFLINKSSEMFLHRFAQDAFANAVKERRIFISYDHLSSVVSTGKRYEFLSDFVPKKVKAEYALKVRALVET